MTAQAEADPVRDVCGQLARHLAALAALTAEPDSGRAYGDRMQGRVSAAPLPGNPAALLALTTIHGAARWWEAVLLYHHGGNGVWGRRGGSDANTRAALDAIVQLAAGADGDTVRMLLADLGRAEADASALPAIDEAQQWRHLRGRACPYCRRLVTLKVLLDARGRSTGHVECHAAAGCRDSNGRRPAAIITVNGLEWNDGLVETAPGLEG